MSTRLGSSTGYRDEVRIWCYIGFALAPHCSEIVAHQLGAETLQMSVLYYIKAVAIQYWYQRVMVDSDLEMLQTRQKSYI